MRRKVILLCAIVLSLVTATMAANYISKQARVWSVTVVTAGYEYDVSVNAYTGKVMKLVRQSQNNLVSQNEAQQAAVLAMYGGPIPSGTPIFVVASKLNDMDEGGKGWEVVVQSTGRNCSDKLPRFRPKHGREPGHAWRYPSKCLVCPVPRPQSRVEPTPASSTPLPG